MSIQVSTWHIGESAEQTGITVRTLTFMTPREKLRQTWAAVSHDAQTLLGEQLRDAALPVSGAAS